MLSDRELAAEHVEVIVHLVRNRQLPTVCLSLEIRHELCTARNIKSAMAVQ